MLDRLPDSEITPRDVYVNRRTFMRAGLLAATAAGTALLYRRLNAVASGRDRDAGDCRPGHGAARERLLGRRGPDAARRRSSTTTTSTSSRPTRTAWPSAAAGFKTTGWKVAVGGLVHKPRVFDLDDLRRLSPPEERVYRMRCVEAWSMVIPWAGLLAVEAARARSSRRPTPSTSRSRRCTIRRGCRTRSTDVLEWPYVEGLRLDEAMHPLTLLATGLYGQELPPQDGAPVRLVTPWKYGFKGIKSIVKITLTATQPPSTWNLRAPDEYGFFANVNPQPRSPALEPGHRAAHRRVRPPPDADVQRLRRPGREPLRGHGPRCPLLSRSSTPGSPSGSSSSTAWSPRRCWCGTPPPSARRQRGQLRDPHDRPDRAGAHHAVAGHHAAARAHGLEPADRRPPQPRRARLSSTSPPTSRSSSCSIARAASRSTLHEIVDAPVPVVRHGALALMIAARRHLDRRAWSGGSGARRWKRLHRLAYAIAVAAVVHYYLLVKSDVRQPLAFAAVLGAAARLSRWSRTMSGCGRSARRAPRAAIARPRRRRSRSSGRASSRSRGSSTRRTTCGRSGSCHSTAARCRSRTSPVNT